MKPQPEPLAVELLATADERRAVTVAEHAKFRQSLTPPPAVDPIDELVAELRTLKKDDN